MDYETAKEKVAKLMAMANDGRGNENEMEAALRQAQKLMLKFGIDAATLQERTGHGPVYKWITVLVPVSRRPVKTAPYWFGVLITGVGKFTDCKVSYANTKEYGVCAQFSGDEMDVQYAVWLCKYLRDDCQHQSTMGFTGMPDEQKSFRKAYAIRVAHRMQILLREREAALKAHVTKTGTALVVVNQKIALRDEQFGQQRYAKSRGIRLRADGAMAGRAAGDRANFGRPIGSQATGEAEMKQRIIKVRLACTEEYVDETTVKVLNCEEDIQGQDRLTFTCPVCNKKHKSLRYGR